MRAARLHAQEQGVRVLDLNILASGQRTAQHGKCAVDVAEGIYWGSVPIY